VYKLPFFPIQSVNYERDIYVDETVEGEMLLMREFRCREIRSSSVDPFHDAQDMCQRTSYSYSQKEYRTSLDSPP
jgi:hypothetical protein